MTSKNMFGMVFALYVTEITKGGEIDEETLSVFIAAAHWSS